MKLEPLKRGRAWVRKYTQKRFKCFHPNKFLLTRGKLLLPPTCNRMVRKIINILKGKLLAYNNAFDKWNTV